MFDRLAGDPGSFSQYFGAIFKSKSKGHGERISFTMIVLWFLKVAPVTPMYIGKILEGLFSCLVNIGL